MTAGADAAPRKPLTALVTGGGGFLGRAIVERLVARGNRARSLARRSYPELAGLGVETIQGDITDAAIMDRACEGCDVVFHVAAKAGVWGPYDDYHRPNVIGTEVCLAASRRCGVRRFVYTSSPSVVFDGRDMEGVDESVPYPKHPRSPYSATKALAEQMVLAASSDTFRAIALRPHLIWGPRDPHIVPRILAQARTGQLRIIGRGDNRVDTTYIDNAADAHLCAADALQISPAPAGRAYFISNGQPVVVWDIVNGILHAAGLPPVTQRVSRRAAVAAGATFELLHKLLRRGGEPRLTRFVAEELSSAHWFDITAARRDLGYEPKVTIAEGLERLAAWLRNNPRM